MCFALQVISLRIPDDSAVAEADLPPPPASGREAGKASKKRKKEHKVTPDDVCAGDEAICCLSDMLSIACTLPQLCFLHHQGHQAAL